MTDAAGSCMRCAALVFLLLGGCYVGAGGRVAVGVKGPDRGRVHVGPEIETGFAVVRLGAGVTMVNPTGLEGSIGLSLPLGILDSDGASPRYTPTGGASVGRYRSSEGSRTVLDLWGGAARRLADDKGCGTDKVEGTAVEIGVRSLGRSLELFIAPWYRYMAAFDLFCG